MAKYKAEANKKGHYLLGRKDQVRATVMGEDCVITTEQSTSIQTGVVFRLYADPVNDVEKNMTPVSATDQLIVDGQPWMNG